MNHIFARIGNHMTGGQFGSLLKELDIRYIRNRWGRATARGQGTTTRFSKASPTGDTNINGDGHDYAFVFPYLSSVYGASGGPTVGDDMILLNRSASPQAPDWVIAGKISSTAPSDTLSLCPLILPCYPPDITATPAYNAGTLSLGPWPSVTTPNGTLYDSTVDNWPEGTLNPWLLIGIDKTDAASVRDPIKVTDKGSSYRTSFGVFAAPAGTLSTNVMPNNQTEMHLYTHGNVRLDGQLNAGYGLGASHSFNGAVAFNMSSLSTGGLSVLNAPAIALSGDSPTITAQHSTAITLAGGAGGVQITGSGGLSLGSTTVFTPTNGVTMPGGKNIALATTTGTKIGTAINQLLAFFGATPIAQPASTNGAVTAGATYGATEQAMLSDAYGAMRALGLLS